MKLLHVADRFGWSAGGGDRYLEEIPGLLATQGIRNSLIYRNGNPARLDSVPQAVELPGFMRFTGGAPDARHRLMQILHDWQPDAAIVYCVPNPSFGLTLAQSVPTVLYAQDYEAICPAGTQWWRLPNTACRRTTGLPCFVNAFTKGCSSRRPGHLLSSYYRAAASPRWLKRAHTIAISTFVKRRFLAAGLDGARVHVVRYPMSAPASTPAVDHAHDVPTVLFVGRVGREKGLDHLLEALAQNLDIPWRLVVAGEGPLVPECRDLASRRGVAPRVDFAGWLAGADLEAAYANASLVAVPSLWPEPYALVGPEAMIRGRPVIGYASGGIPEWLIPGQTGLLAQAGDIPGLAAALRQLLVDASLRERMGSQARAWALDAHNPGKHLHDLQAVIARAIATHRAA